MKTAIFFTFVALLARLSLAIPPGCLLHAVNTQDEPSDLSAVCGDGAKDVQKNIADNCGEKFEQVAQKAFIDTCLNVGTTVAAYTATSTGSSSSHSATGTGMVTSTRSSGAGSATGTGSSVQSTAGANAEYRQAALGPMAAAAVALIGAVAAL